MAMACPLFGSGFGSPWWGVGPEAVANSCQDNPARHKMIPFFTTYYFSVKIVEKSSFVMHSKSKSKANKTVSKFGTFWENPVPIRPQIRLAANFFTLPLYYTAELSASWQPTEV
jgi:hypothetical protein